MTTWVLFDDPAADVLRPLTWLRPASELLFGAETLEARWRRLVGDDELQVVTRDELAPLRPARIGWREIHRLGPGAVWVRDRFVPTASSVAALRRLEPGQAAVRCGHVSALRPSESVPAGAGRMRSSAETLASLESCSDQVELDSGDFLAGLGDLVRVQAWVLQEDLARLLGGRSPSVPSHSSAGTRGDASGPIGDGFGYAPERILLHPSAYVDHGAVLDARDGGIVLGPGCEVRPGSYLRGPLFAGERCLFLGGTVGSGSSFGPVSRLRGEIETTVFLGFSNKVHDGFVGHSYVGEWVNLGALTTTSDLKNDYGRISLEVGGQRVPTGLDKIGTFFGDHAKTRIGCLLNTGTIVGLGANVFGSATVPERQIVDFQWGTGDDAMEYRIEKFLAVARIVLGRRKVAWTPAYEAALRFAHAESGTVRAKRVERA